MNVNLKIWRQGSDSDKGTLKTYRLENIDPNISFLEMLDILNIKLVKEKKDPVAFDHDCREGICGSCGFMINGRPHGPQKATTVCQLHMRAFNNEDDILLEPFRAESFPVIKDLSVDRKSFDRIISSGGYVSTNTGRRLRPTLFQSKKNMLMKPSFHPPVSVVVPVLLLAKILQQCYLLQQKFLIYLCCPKDKKKEKTGLLKW